ncbi:unnamed protein product [Brassica oleracea]
MGIRGRERRCGEDDMQFDPTVETEDLAGPEGMDSLFSDLANAIPGIDEAMSFAQSHSFLLCRLVQTMDYATIVFDTAPTGHTLRLLQFPATLEKGLSKLKSRFGGLMNQMSRLFGMEDELGEDALLGRLEGLKDVIQHVNRQFKDPELAKFEIDTHNIIINQVLYDDEGGGWSLFLCRFFPLILSLFYMLYDDFNITKLPPLPQEVTGVEALKAFSDNFLTPYHPTTSRSNVEDQERRVHTLRLQLKTAEEELERIKS